MTRKLQLVRVAIGGVVLLSFFCFFFYSYQVSNVPPSSIVNTDGNTDAIGYEPEDTTVGPETVTIRDTVTSVKTVTVVKSADGAPAAKPTPCDPPRIDGSKLDVEQIEADFPGDYKNPNPWFRAPGQPNQEELLNLLSEDEQSLLPEFGLQEHHSPRSLEKISRFYGINMTGSWNDHINDLDDNGLAPLTKWAQNYIYKHQHPDSCEGKKFYVLRNKWPRHGLGAIVRRIFIELTNAMQSGRILVLDPKDAPGNTLVEKDCASWRGGPPSLECLVDELTSCAAYITPENSVDDAVTAEFPGGSRRDVPPLASMAMMSYMREAGLASSGTLLRYWWRSQLYGYILRPNRVTLDRMREKRLDPDLHKGAATTRNEKSRAAGKNYTEAEVPFPLPISTISMHIRHGDKAGEGRLVSTRDYIVTAERYLLRNPLRYRKRAFMSTEDPLAIQEALNTPFVNPARSYANLDWHWYYSDIPRVDGGPQANLKLEHNKTDALITHVMQLWMAVECDTFVGNRNSNWNKMIDGIRCTLMDKCRAPYLDAGFVADWVNFP